MTRVLSSLFLFTILIWNIESAKILVIFPMPAHSHFSLGFRLAKELADRGHQMTVINPYPQKTPIKNYKDVSVEENVEFIEELKKQLFKFNTLGPYDNLHAIYGMGIDLTENTFQNKRVQDLLKSGETFDLVIMEHFLNDAEVGIAHHFKAPFVLISPFGLSRLNNHVLGNPLPSSYIPNLIGTFSKHMTFWERLQNFLLNILTDLVRELSFMPRQRQMFKKYIKTDLELDDVLYNASLMMTNSHVSVNDAVPRVPGVIEIGGFHVNPPKKLPEDLQKFLDESKDGVVLFSMGSNLKSKDLQPEVRDAILQSFSKIKQKVLWKFETDLPNAPKNVKIMKWLPQQDILAHPNVVAFITHGGLLSTLETVTRGVPIIGIPVFGDQKANIAAAVTDGYGVSVPLPELSEEKLSWALNEILNNPKYRQNVKQRSKLMNDQPLKPLDSAVYWVEHVLRHGGAPHLRSAALDLKWYQREMVDIFLFLALVAIITLVVICKIIKICIGLCCKQPRVSKTKKRN
ncbi:UDP-glycosyltransferase UGT5-like [Tribolium castaneum]|uniref:UDP-glycosyltransferase UGT5-like n=1 Tax=Tribolium castaneum TaxID=7070 RepID=UPI00046C1CF6|nr:PREDICTED: UDP-glucuronosyltransferase 2C1-like [Tribolium castaneum]|eukprot:XP_008197588.1 PREDICTED: UDP-glucuronosyltransferase 2C1-like [Tribolium castaneum]